MITIELDRFFRDAYAYASAYGLDDPEVTEVAHKMAADAHRLGRIDFESFDRDVRRRIYQQNRLARLRESALEPPSPR